MNHNLPGQAPNNKHVPADSDEEDDVILDDDHHMNDDMIFDASDKEVESEDDSWFDQFIAAGVSSSSLGSAFGDAQPQLAVSDSQPGGSCAIEGLEPIVIDTQLMEEDSLAPTELDPPTPAALPCKEFSSPGRMVARPLAGQSKDIVHEIEESPVVKKEELVSVASDPARSLREKEAHKRLLMGRLAELNRAIESFVCECHFIFPEIFSAWFHFPSQLPLELELSMVTVSIRCQLQHSAVVYVVGFSFVIGNQKS